MSDHVLRRVGEKSDRRSLEGMNGEVKQFSRWLAMKWQRKVDSGMDRVVGLEQVLFQDFYHACRRVGRGQADREMKSIKDGEASKTINK